MLVRHIPVAVMPIFLLFAIPQSLPAQPSEVSYQGELKKDGLPYTGTAQMKFVIVDGEGESIWSNDGTSAAGSEPTDFVSIDTENGIFAVRLGASPMEPITGGLLKGVTEVALRVWVNTGDGFEQLTDQPISSSAFSLSGEKCLEIGDLQINVVPRWDGSALVPGALFDDGNNVGVGTSTPTTKLDVAGTVRSAAGGFQFPDGTTQTTAVTGGGGGVPSGAMILTTSLEAPDGYKYSGMKLTTVDSNFWQLAGPVEERRSHFGIATIDNLVYVIGGLDIFAGWVALNREYNPVNDSWMTRTPMPNPRGGVGAVSLGEKIFVVGGSSNVGHESVNESYSPIDDTWEVLAPMLQNRAYLGLAAWNGKLYAIGGDVPFAGVVADMEEYDVASDSWIPRAPMPAPRAFVGAVAVNGRVYVFGGVDENSVFHDSVFEYDISSDSWAVRSNMSSPRFGPATCLAGDKVFVLGGAFTSPTGTNPMSVVEVFDPITDQWGARPEMPYANFLHGAAFASGLLVVVPSYQGAPPNFVALYKPPVEMYGHWKN